MAPISQTLLIKYVPNLHNKNIGESCVQTSPPNQNAPLVNALFAKVTTKPILATSGKS